MEDNMKITKILTKAAAVLLAVLMIQIWLLYSTKPGPLMIAQWIDQPGSLDDLESLADEVVVARVVKIRHADDLMATSPKPDDGSKPEIIRIPVEVITLEIKRKAKGKKKEGKEIIEVFHTGHSDAVSPAKRKAPSKKEAPKKPKDGIDKNKAAKASKDEAVESNPINLLEDDPAYKVGEDYLLFIVKEGPKLKVKGKSVQTSAIVSPEGRYKVSKTNKLDPVRKRGFAGKYKGKDVADIETEVATIQKEKKGKK